MLTRYMANLLMSKLASWLTSVVLSMLSIRLMSAAVGIAGMTPAPPMPTWPDPLQDPPALDAAAAAAADVLAPCDCINAWRLRPLASCWAEDPIPVPPLPEPLCSCICIDWRVGVVGTDSGGVDETNAWSCGTNVTITEKELVELVTLQVRQKGQELSQIQGGLRMILLRWSWW